MCGLDMPYFINLQVTDTPLLYHLVTLNQSSDKLYFANLEEMLADFINLHEVKFHFFPCSTLPSQKQQMPMVNVEDCIFDSG